MPFAFFRKTILILTMSLLIGFSTQILSAQEMKTTNYTCVVYLTGIGCHNCALIDPVLFVETTAANPNLVIFEYEIFKSREANQETKNKYFETYWKDKNSGVPFLLYKEGQASIGRYEVGEAIKQENISKTKTNLFPKIDGTGVPLEKLDIADLPGDVKIWTKDRVLFKLAENGNNDILRQLITEKDLSSLLANLQTIETDAIAMPISGGELPFQHAVIVSGWQVQWNGKPISAKKNFSIPFEKISIFLIGGILLWMLFSIIKLSKDDNGHYLEIKPDQRTKDIIISGIAMIGLIAFFLFAKHVSPQSLKDFGYSLPLPLFTFIIALVDGFNPCNMFVLICLLVMLISTSESKLRLYTVAFSFVAMVFLIYFLFMAAWLNVFKYLSFVTPLRIGIAIVSVIAGLINCKELLFFKKGISLTIKDEHKNIFYKRMQKMKDIIKNGSFPLLITSSIGLATLASLIELPCTAGFPIIYTGILSGKHLEHTFGYYSYLLLYNAVYVLPLLVIVSIFIFTFRARQISERQVQVIKFIGGFIMILLGIILLVNPGLLGMGLS